jgi:hypothetical protein
MYETKNVSCNIYFSTKIYLFIHNIKDIIFL